MAAPGVPWICHCVPRRYHYALYHTAGRKTRFCRRKHPDAVHFIGPILLQQGSQTQAAFLCGSDMNPNSFAWTGPEADFTPDSNDLPWCLVPEKKITVEDVKYILSGHYQKQVYP